MQNLRIFQASSLSCCSYVHMHHVQSEFLHLCVCVHALVVNPQVYMVLWLWWVCVCVRELSTSSVLCRVSSKPCRRLCVHIMHRGVLCSWATYHCTIIYYPKCSIHYPCVHMHVIYYHPWLMCTFWCNTFHHPLPHVYHPLSHVYIFI